MAVGVFDRVWKYSKHGGTELLVLLAIADNANEETCEAWPSIAYLAQKTRLSERGVQKVIRRLQQSGELTVLPPSTARKANTYRVNVTAPRGEQRSGVNNVQGERDTGGRGEQNDQAGVNHRSPKPSIEPSIEPSDTPCSPPDPFELFWKAYPRKTGKGAARKSWEKQAKALPPIDDLVAIVERHKRTKGWMKDNGQFIPLPTTWLNQQRWEDEVVTEDDEKHRREDEERVRMGMRPIWGTAVEQ